MTDKKMTDESQEQETTISGKAENLKAGAVLMIDENTPVFIDTTEFINEYNKTICCGTHKIIALFLLNSNRLINAHTPINMNISDEK